MGKNIVVLSDGTGQEGGKSTDSNVYKLFKMLENRTSRQIVFYDRGLGTGFYRKLSGSIGGMGLSRNIKECYEFIFENYEAGDQIYLFGFSRGATTVRSLSSLIHYFGILPKSRPELIGRAYQDYKKEGRIGLRRISHKILEKLNLEYELTDPKDKDSIRERISGELLGLMVNAGSLKEENFAEFADSFAKDLLNRYLVNPLQSFDNQSYWQSVKERTAMDLFDRLGRKVETDDFVNRYHTMWTNIRFLGVWDTVSALGLPIKALDAVLDKIPYFRHSFQNLAMSKCVEHGRHALALDDERKTFHPEIWDEEIFPHQTMKQVWFPGMHTDVGGGYKQTGLSDISLSWMVAEAVKYGLYIYPHHSIAIHPQADGFMNDSRGTTLSKLYPRQVRFWDQASMGKPLVHQSVLDRTRDRYNSPDSPYAPWIKDQSYETEPWSEGWESACEVGK